MILNKKNAIRVFYYLLAIDHTIEQNELTQLDRIGAELDGEAYGSYKEELFAECNKTVQACDEDELYDILSENVDKVCIASDLSAEEGIPSRLLLWNMLVMAFSDQKYDDTEKRLIHHVARTCEINKSVLLEMESHIKTVISIENQLDEYQKSALPYAEIRPIVDELESRKSTIKKCISELIADELYANVDKLEVKEDFVDKAKTYCAEKTAPIVSKVGEVKDKAWADIKEKSAPIVTKVGEESKKAWADIKEKSAPVIDTSKKTLGKVWSGLKGKFKSVVDTKKDEKEQQ